jgi:hypothetical protein
MIFDKDVFPGYPSGFLLKDTGIGGVVQNIREHHHIKRRVSKRKMLAVKHLYRDLSVFANQYVDPTSADVRPVGLKQRGDESVTAANIKHARAVWDQPNELLRKDSYPPTEDQSVM